MNYEYCEGVTHTIKKGDTLYEISRKYNVALALLLRANPYVDVFNLQVGDTICIPAGSQMPPYPISGGGRGNNRDNRNDRDDRDDRNDWDDRDDRDDRNDDRNDRDDRNDTMEEILEDRIDELDDTIEERYREIEPDEMQENTSVRNWEKYVVQPGDTLEDVLRDMDGGMMEFVERNHPSTIYMLPGVAYYICKTK